MPRPAVGSLELPCWTIICGSVGAVVTLAVILLTAAGLSSDDGLVSLSLPICTDAAPTTCKSNTAAAIIKMTNGTGPCTVTCPIKEQATYYVKMCADIRVGAFYARCMAKGTAPNSMLMDFNNTAQKALITPDGVYCDKQERIWGDKYCYPVADAHNLASDPDSTFDVATAWETLYHLMGSVDSNRCGYLTYRDLIKVHNCHPEGFGCAAANPVGDEYLNKDGTGSKLTIAGTGQGTTKAVQHYTTCIKKSEVKCGTATTGAPGGYTWLNTLQPIPNYGKVTPPAKNYVYGDRRKACPGSAAEQQCAVAAQQEFTCLMGVAPRKGGWRKV